MTKLSQNKVVDEILVLRHITTGGTQRSKITWPRADVVLSCARVDNHGHDQRVNKDVNPWTPLLLQCFDDVVLRCVACFSCVANSAEH